MYLRVVVHTLDEDSNRMGVTRALSFDDDFAVYRYGRSRDKAFEILR
jgi:hypothetical protein